MPCVKMKCIVVSPVICRWVTGKQISKNKWEVIILNDARCKLELYREKLKGI